MNDVAPSAWPTVVCSRRSAQLARLTRVADERRAG
jgi:hypothetical protein